jgi:hypothetical protein
VLFVASPERHFATGQRRRRFLALPAARRMRESPDNE